MRGLSLTAPYGTLISITERWPELGKHHETRSWATPYRGWVAIHQSKNLKPVGGVNGLADICNDEPFLSTLGRWVHDHKVTAPFQWISVFPLGAVVAVAWIEECYQVGRKGSLFAHGTTRPLPTGNDLAFGDYTPGRFAWRLTKIRALPTPLPCRGMQGLWTVPADVEAAVWAELGQVAA